MKLIVVIGSVQTTVSAVMMCDKLQKSLSKLNSQLFGVRGLVNALAGRDLSRPRLVRCFQRIRRQAAVDQSGDESPHSKESTYSLQEIW